MKTTLALCASALFLTACPGGMPHTLERQRLCTFNYENILGTSLELKIGARSLPEAEAAERAKEKAKTPKS